MSKQNNQRMENQFAIFSNNKYMNMKDNNPYPNINTNSVKVRKNIGEWGTKNEEIYKAPECTKKVDQIATEIKHVPKIAVTLPPPTILIPRLNNRNCDENINSDSE